MRIRFNLILIILCLGFFAKAQNPSSSPTDRKTRIACVGASITEGALTTNPATDSYPAQLGTILGDGYEMMNFGVSSSTMLKNGDFPYWTKGKLKEALASDPDIVFIDLGGNDAKECNRGKLNDEFRKDALEMISMFRHLPSRPRVILLTPIVSFWGDQQGIWDPCIVNQVGPLTIEAAKEAGVEYIDMHPVLDSYPELLSDGVHPDTKGSRMMAEYIKKYLLDHPQPKERHNVIANPMPLNYRFQPAPDSVRREAADPVVEWFKDAYYLFASKSDGYWRSTDLKDWDYIHSTSIGTINEYAPTILPHGEWLYYLASDNPRIFRTKNPEIDNWEEIESKFPVMDEHDPSFYEDEDGKVYLYWGCHDVNPIMGVEVDPENGFAPIGEPVALIFHNEDKYGWERPGVNNEEPRPGWNEGPAMMKIDGKYYLQYAAPGTQYRIYGDGLYVSDNPLGPYTYVEDTPFSFKPGGFIGGAGHGHTFRDKYGNLWHVASMTIAVRHWFERRLGIFPVVMKPGHGFYALSGMGDYPFEVPTYEADWKTNDPFMDWNVLSKGKKAFASSFLEGYEPGKGADEIVETWWSAKSGNIGEWFAIDLGKPMTINAIQVNLADQDFKVRPPHGKIPYRYHIEVSDNGRDWHKVAGQYADGVDMVHRLFVFDEPLTANFVRIMNDAHVDGRFSLFDLRVFGNGGGKVPASVKGFKAMRDKKNKTIYRFSWNPVEDADGYVISWGIDPMNLTHQTMVDGNTYEARYFNRDSKYYFTITPFNENGMGKPSAMIR